MKAQNTKQTKNLDAASVSSKSKLDSVPDIEAKSFNRPNSALFSAASKEKDAMTEYKSSNFDPHMSDIQNLEGNVFEKRIKILLKGGGIAELASDEKSSLNRQVEIFANHESRIRELEQILFKTDENQRSRLF